jgi:hypothetical protein
MAKQCSVSSRYTQGSIVNLGDSDIGLETFDLVVFSACLPYSFDDWSPLLTALGDHEGQESKMMLAVEPDAKHDLLTSFRRRLVARGWPTVVFCCHDLLDVIKQDSLPLRETTDVWRRLGLDGSPKTWWNPLDDKFLVANPEPKNSRRSGDTPFSRVEALEIGPSVRPLVSALSTPPPQGRALDLRDSGVARPLFRSWVPL